MNTHLDWVRGFILSVTVLASLGASPSQAQPANDLFAHRMVITGTNIAVSISNVGATREEGEPYLADNFGGASLWWSWKAPATGPIAISTAGSTLDAQVIGDNIFDTVLGVYTGSSVAALTEVASNDDADYDAGIVTSKVVFNAVSNQTYQIVVDGSFGQYEAQVGMVRLSLQMPPPPTPVAPAWMSPDLEGVTVNSSSFASKVVILDFWATWCSPCLQELPDLVALQAQYGADGLVIVGADVGGHGFGGQDDTTEVVKSFLSTWTPAVNFPMVMASDVMLKAYGVSQPNSGLPFGIPVVFIIDRQNQIRKQYLAGPQSRSELENQIIPLLYGNTQLDCQAGPNLMVLRWPTNALTFTLESTSSLTSPAWADWPATPTVVQGTNTVQVPTDGTPRYFRLRMAY
jgi:thiol-disulfide isomerase/thioredoxin